MDVVPAQLWAQLGMGAVLLFLLVYTFREWKVERDKKDSQINVLTERVLEAYITNTQAQAGVQAAIDNNTKAIDNNTRAVNEIRDKLCMDKT